jgi:hypothetical protein
MGMEGVGGLEMESDEDENVSLLMTTVVVP